MLKTSQISEFALIPQLKGEDIFFLKDAGKRANSMGADGSGGASGVRQRRSQSQVSSNWMPLTRGGTARMTPLGRQLLPEITDYER